MMNPITVEDVRRDFPFFGLHPELTYLDSSATSQRLKAAIDAEEQYYFAGNASPFRGLYDLSEKATEAYENARSTVARFINAPTSEDIIFTRNASESLNLLAYSLTNMVIKPGDQIVVGVTEHHSNMLPWRAAARRLGAEIVYWECDPEGYYDPESLKNILNEKTKIVAVTQVSNVFGRVNDIKTFARICHENGTLLVADGAQSVPHMKVDVQDLDCDFLSFSGHKMLAPMGIGVLYGKKDLLEQMPPFMEGGEMIDMVTFDRVVYSPLPHKFEAGTVNTGGALALAAACDYYEKLGLDWIEKQEGRLSLHLAEGVKSVPHVTMLGSQDPREHQGIVAFKIDGVHPHDVSAIFSDSNICIRAGHHCAQPLHKFLGIPSSSRASLMFYNTIEEVDRFLNVLETIRSQMGYGE